MNNFFGIRGSETRIIKILEDLPLGIISFNADGLIDFVNPAFLKMGVLYRLKIPSLIDSNIFEKDIIPGISLIEEISELKKGFPFEKEIKNLKTADGSEISVIIKCSPVYENEQYAGGIIVLEDLKVISDSREEDLLKIESFKKVTNEIADLFFIVDAEGIINYSAGSLLKTLSIADPKKLNVVELIPDLPDNFLEILSEVRDKNFEKRIILNLIINNEQTYYECFVNILSTKQPRFFTCTFINISDKIKSQNLKDRLNIFETVADITSDGIIGVNAEGIITLWSPSVLSLTGFLDEEVLGKSLWQFIPTLNQKSFTQLKEDLQQIHFFKKQILILNKAGNEIAVNASFLLGDDDNIIISLTADSKEIKPEAFKTLEENFRNLVIKSDVIVLNLNPTGIIQYLNPSFTTQTNFDEDESVGRNLNEFLTSGSKIDFETFQKESEKREVVLLNKRGEKIYYTANISPLFIDKTLNGFNIYLTNISEIKSGEKELKLFKFLFENTKEGIAVETKGKIIFANTAFGKMFGYAIGQEIVGKDILDLAATSDVLKVAEYLQHYQAKKDLSQQFEFSGKKKDGSTFFSELSPSTFKVDENRYLILIIRDITERKKAQQVIRESEEKYRNLIENIDDFLFTLEKSRLFFKPVFFTGAVKKISGFTQTELSDDIKLLLKLIHPDDLPGVKKNLKSFSKSKSKMSEEFEFRIINRQGNIVWVRNKLTITRNEKGKVQKVYGLVSDISLRRKAEDDLQKSTQNLIKLNETKDRFISIISHDLRTPFSSILGFTDLILNDDTLSEKERNQYISYIQESSNAMLSLVNSLLDWTRLQTGRIRFEPERVEATEVIAKSINTLSGAALQKNISVVSTIKDNLFIYVDKDLIGQVFNNLISNAIKFTKKEGSIVISASPSTHIRFYEFSVKDNGIGIKPEDAKKLFGIDTKFTTEGTMGEKGTGLGLSLVKEIIEKHGGTIHVESDLGAGANFLFTLPGAAANILLVDPNTTDRILYSKILKHITTEYNIETASNGKEALNKISSSTYALIITEHNMPVMGGYDLAIELKKLESNIKPPLIVLSNAIDRETIDEYNRIGIEQVFQKPVNLSIFKLAVEKSLHQGLK